LLDIKELIKLNTIKINFINDEEKTTNTIQTPNANLLSSKKPSLVGILPIPSFNFKNLTYLDILPFRGKDLNSENKQRYMKNMLSFYKNCLDVTEIILNFQKIKMLEDLIFGEEGGCSDMKNAFLHLRIINILNIKEGEKMKRQVQIEGLSDIKNMIKKQFEIYT